MNSKVINIHTNHQKYFFLNARTAFLRSMELLNLSKKDKILLPAYIGFSEREGSGVFDPVRKLGVGYGFYALNSNLSVNKEDFLKKIRQKNIKAVLVIHYFGFCQPGFDYIVQSCKKYKKYLIEDCAHALYSSCKGKKLGTYGDLSIYSIHKILPIRSGGILMINNLKSSKKISLQENISRSAKTALMQADLVEISRRRRDNYEYISKRIRKINGVKVLFKNLPAGIVPQSFPIVIENDIRDKVYFYLRRKKVRVSSLYYRLILQIKKSDYPISYYLSRHILNLPIHQTISKEKINFMLKILSEALKKYESTSL